MNLTEPEPAALVPEPRVEPVDDGFAPDRPPAGYAERSMSERRRRRLADEERRAGEMALAEAERAAAPQAPANREVAAVTRVQPTYPPEAFRAGEEGTVLVRVDVDASGNPTNVDVARRSGSRELDRAALDAVRKWRFDPAIKDGKPVAASAEVPVEFKLASQ